MQKMYLTDWFRSQICTMYTMYSSSKEAKLVYDPKKLKLALCKLNKESICIPPIFNPKRQMVKKSQILAGRDGYAKQSPWQNILKIC